MDNLEKVKLINLGADFLANLAFGIVCGITYPNSDFRHDAKEEITFAKRFFQDSIRTHFLSEECDHKECIGSVIDTFEPIICRDCGAEVPR